MSVAGRSEWHHEKTRTASMDTRSAAGRIFSDPLTSTLLSARESQKTAAGSAAFQTAGVAEAPFRGFRLALPPADIRGCRQDADAPRVLGRRGAKGVDLRPLSTSPQPLSRRERGFCNTPCRNRSSSHGSERCRGVQSKPPRPAADRSAKPMFSVKSIRARPEADTRYAN